MLRTGEQNCYGEMAPLNRREASTSGLKLFDLNFCCCTREYSKIPWTLPPPIWPYIFSPCVENKLLLKMVKDGIC